MKPRYEQLAAAADAIEVEMRDAGLWRATPPTPEAMRFQRAFGADTLAFEQWLQFVLLPRLREIVATRGPIPPTSQVGAYAVREFDGRDECQALTSRLCALDALFPAAFGTTTSTRLGWRDGALIALLLLAVLVWGWDAVRNHNTDRFERHRMQTASTELPKRIHADPQVERMLVASTAQRGLDEMLGRSGAPQRAQVHEAIAYAWPHRGLDIALCGAIGSKQVQRFVWRRSQIHRFESSTPAVEFDRLWQAQCGDATARAFPLLSRADPPLGLGDKLPSRSAVPDPRSR